MVEKRLIIGLILAVLFIAHAEVKTIYGEYTYVYSDSETLVDARRKCFDFARRDALEKFATYISSESVVRNYITERDEIISSTMGIIRNIQVVEEQVDRANNSIYYKISAEVDEEEVLEMIRQRHGSSELRSKISDFLQTAQSAEADNRIGEALRYYYWSLMLQKSDPSGNSLRIETFDPRLLSIAIPEKINILLSGLEFSISDISESRNYKGIDIDVKYNGQPVRNLDYNFYNGLEWSRNVKVLNGRSKVELYGDAAGIVAVLLLNIDYKYEDQAQHNSFVKEAFGKTNHVPFPTSSVRLAITAPTKAKEEVEKETVEVITEEMPVEVVEPVTVAPAVPVMPEPVKISEPEVSEKEPFGIRPFERNFVFGIKSGINGATLTGDTRDDLDVRGGPIGGVHLDMQLNRFFSIQAEFLFSMKGAYFEGDIYEYDPYSDTYYHMWGFFDYEFQYLEFPFLAKFRYDTQNISLSAYTGFSFEICIDAVIFYSTDFGHHEQIDINDQIADVGFNIIFGFGFDYKLTESFRLLSELRYTGGITSIDDYDGPHGDPLDIYNSVVSFMVGVGF